MNNRSFKSLRFDRFMEIKSQSNDYIYCKPVRQSGQESNVFFDAIYPETKRKTMVVEGERIFVISRKDIRLCTMCLKKIAICVESYVDSEGVAEIEELLCLECAKDIMKYCDYEDL